MHAQSRKVGNLNEQFQNPIKSYEYKYDIV